MTISPVKMDSSQKDEIKNMFIIPHALYFIPLFSLYGEKNVLGEKTEFFSGSIKVSIRIVLE